VVVPGGGWTGPSPLLLPGPLGLPVELQFGLLELGVELPGFVGHVTGIGVVVPPSLPEVCSSLGHGVEVSSSCFFPSSSPSSSVCCWPCAGVDVF
jgi:hypothetical protein